MQYAERCREAAAEFRRLAEWASYEGVRAELFQTAVRYEQLALEYDKLQRGES